MVWHIGYLSYIQNNFRLAVFVTRTAYIGSMDTLMNISFTTYMCIVYPYFDYSDVLDKISGFATDTHPDFYNKGTNKSWKFR